MNTLCLSELTALEALEYAWESCDHASETACAVVDESSDNKASQTKIRDIFDAVQSLNTWRTKPVARTPSIVVSLLRSTFVHHPTPAQIAAVTGQIAVVLLEHLGLKTDDPKALSVCALQLTAATLSLMRLHTDVEYHLYVLDACAKIWNPDAIDHLARCFIAQLPTQCESLRQWRNKKANLPPDAQLPNCSLFAVADAENVPPNDAAALQAFLNGEKRVGAASPALDHLLAALARRASGDSQWFTHLLRREHAFSELPNLWSENTSHAFQHFAIFWLAQAFREADAPKQALQWLESVITTAPETPAIWFLFADILIDTAQFGRALHAIEQAEHLPFKTSAKTFDSSGYPIDISIEMQQNVWTYACQTLRHKLAKAALHHAQTSPSVDPALLELALLNGDTPTQHRAALCIFDAHIRELDDALLQTLAQSQPLREKCIESFLAKRDCSKLDQLYDLYNRLAALLPPSPELSLLDAASKLDAPVQAIHILSHTLPHLPTNTDIYWAAIDLWIILNIQSNDLEQAIIGAAPALILDSPFALRALLLLLSSLPNGAAKMAHQLICETVGADKTIAAFKKLNALKNNPYESLKAQIVQYQAKNHPVQPQITLDEIATYMMPLPYQALKHLHALTSSPRNKLPSPFADILKAHANSDAPVQQPPQKAQWIHQPQHRASDAFDS